MYSDLEDMYSIDQQCKSRMNSRNTRISMTSTNLVTGIKSPKICESQENVKCEKNRTNTTNQASQIIKHEGICFGKPVIGGLIATAF